MAEFGTELRGVSLQQKPMSGVAKVVDVPLPPVSSGNFSGQQQAIQQLTNEQMTLAAVLDKGGQMGWKMVERQIATDFHEGQMAQAQGKAIEELGGMATNSAKAGFMSMQAATAADAAYVTAIKDIEKSDKMLDPGQYRAKRAEAFKSQLTGNSMYDQYLTKLNVDVDRKLARNHAEAHTEWQTKQTINDATNLLASKSKVGDTRLIDGFLTGADSPLRNLSTENQRKAVLDAVNQSLLNESDTLFKHLGGVEGIREKFKPSSGEMSSIIKYAEHYKTQQEAKYSAGYQNDMFNLLTSVEQGKLTYPQALEAAEVVTAQYGKGEAANKANAGALAGMAREFQHDLKRKADKRAVLEDKEARVLKAVSENNVAVLPPDEQQMAFLQIHMEAAQEAEALVDDPYTDSTPQFNKLWAQKVNRTGVVDTISAKDITAKFNSTAGFVAKDGKVSDQGYLAYGKLKALYDINPEHALRHLQTDEAKATFMAAVQHQGMGNDVKTALEYAASVSAAQRVTASEAKAAIHSKDGKAAISDAIDTSVSRQFGLIGGVGTSLNLNVSPEELAAYKMDQGYRGLIEKKIEPLVRKGYSIPDAVAAATMSANESVARVFGNTIIHPREGNMYAAFGLEQFADNPMAHQEAVRLWLQKYGKEKFGTAKWSGATFDPRGMKNKVMCALGADGQFAISVIDDNTGLYGNVVEFDPKLLGQLMKEKYQQKATEVKAAPATLSGILH